MKTILLLLSCNVYWVAFSQEYEAKGYASYGDYLTGEYYRPVLTIEKRTQADIFSFGGNDYKVQSDDPKVNNNMIREHVWGVTVNDSLYINASKLLGLGGFIQAEIVGEYMFLSSAFPSNPVVLEQLNLNAPETYSGYYLFGAIGGLVAGVQAGKASLDRIPLLYRPATNELMVLTRSNFAEMLRPYPELRKKFLESSQGIREDQDPVYSLLKKHIHEINIWDKQLALKMFNHGLGYDVVDTVNIHLFHYDRKLKSTKYVVINNQDTIAMTGNTYQVISYPDTMDSFVIIDEERNSVRFGNHINDLNHYIEFNTKKKSEAALKIVDPEWAEFYKKKIDHYSNRTVE
ncbi:MAG: hypothetical protein RIC35_03960 [Marinoscillum sp.]